MFDFQKLTVYQKAKLFHSFIHEKILEPNNLKPYYRDQLGRASLSVALNIAESSSRFTPKSRRNFIVIARGSLFECVAVSEILLNRGSISGEQYQELFNQADQLSRMLFKMIRNLE
ncbi:four helix bundle protein [bacterium SCSIO 12741]|nr:four helix bundle protein [bacterium SCSIO 12741]